MMERSPEYREMDRIVTRLVEGGLINVDPYTESVRVESAGVQQLAAPVEEANRDIVALQSQLAAEREAVRVLGEEVALWHDGHNAEHNDGGPFIVYDHDAEPEELVAYMKRLDAARDKTDTNPIASAAITDAAKAREG